MGSVSNITSNKAAAIQPDEAVAKLTYAHNLKVKLPANANATQKAVYSAYEAKHNALVNQYEVSLANGVDDRGIIRQIQILNTKADSALRGTAPADGMDKPAPAIPSKMTPTAPAPKSKEYTVELSPSDVKYLFLPYYIYRGVKFAGGKGIDAAKYVGGKAVDAGKAVGTFVAQTAIAAKDTTIRAAVAVKDTTVRAAVAVKDTAIAAKDGVKSGASAAYRWFTSPFAKIHVTIDD